MTSTTSNVWVISYESHLITVFKITVSIEKVGRYGTVKCLAGNDYGAVTTEIELVENYEKPSIIAPSYRDVTAIGGETIMIPCSAIGVPSPRISWILPNFSTLHRYSHSLV